MRRCYTFLIPSLLLLTGIITVSRTVSAQTDVLTVHNNNARTGLNATETILTPAKIVPKNNKPQFGKLFTHNVDGYVYAQPLIKRSVTIPNVGVRNVVFIATQNNSLYAYNADTNMGTNANPFWRVNFGTPVPSGDLLTGDLVPFVGITGTPVIDAASDTIYVVSKIKKDGAYIQRLHALSITNGVERAGSPVIIKAAVKGNGWDKDENGNINFNPLREHQRPGLSLSNGTVYIAWASHGDNGPYHGWILGYDAKTLRQTVVFNNSINETTYAGSGIWMSGMGLAIDDAGQLFMTTGNGTFDANVSGVNFGNSVIKVDPKKQKVTDYFTPYDQKNLEIVDADFGSGGFILLPDQPGVNKKLAVTAGKAGTIYLLDRDNLGKFNTSFDDVIQPLPGSLGLGAYSTPSFFNGRVYYQGAGDVLKAFQLGVVTATTQNYDASGGFTATNIKLNGTAKRIGNIIQLTDGDLSQAGTAWAPNPVNVGQFSTAFQFKITDVTTPSADGMTFALQRVGDTAVGNPGGGLGYLGIGNSIAVIFRLWKDGFNVSQTDLYIGGQSIGNNPVDLMTAAVDLHSGHPFDITMTYDGTILSVSIKDNVTRAVSTQTYTVDIAKVIGGTSAYAGFTGGTGGASAIQEVASWSYTSTIPSGTTSFFGLSSKPVVQTKDVFGFPGATPSISSNGAANGIVWVIRNNNPDDSGGDHGSAFTGTLHAYDAMTLAPLFKSDLRPDSPNFMGRYVKFSIPTVANGKVYVGSTSSVSVFSLLDQNVDIMSQVKVVRGNPIYIRDRKVYQQTVTLTNVGSSPIVGPLSLVLDNLPKGIILTNATGKTTFSEPIGSPYVDILPTGTLAPGRSTAVTLFFNRIGAYTTRVLTGPGKR